jgi:hypothetical protein
VAAAEAATVTLAWDASNDPTVVGYRVDYGYQPGVHQISVNVGNQTSRG